MYHYADLIVRCVMQTVQIAVFAYYILTARRYFVNSHSENGGMKDPYTVAMMGILCEVIIYRLCISIPHDFYYLFAEAPHQTSTEPYYLQDEYRYSIFRYMTDFFSESGLRIAVIINMIRWLMVIISKLKA